ncbi:hypothetical protein OAL42_00180 [Akkermansiaceae bacterium]|nr:hypothetical protein [Akkermansiaceae bacterium]
MGHKEIRDLMKNLTEAFYIASGPDLRSFVTSGLVKKRRERGLRTVLIIENLEGFQNLPVLSDYEIISAKRLFRIGILSKISFWLYGIRLKLWKENAKKKNFDVIHFSIGVDNQSSYWGGILALPWFRGLIRLLHQFFLNIALIVDNKNAFPYKISRIYFSGFLSIFTQLTIAKSGKEGANLFYLNNNWKDIYSEFEFPIMPDIVSFWYEELREDALVVSPEIQSAEIRITGNPYFQKLLEIGNNLGAGGAKEKYGIKSKTRLFLWALGQKTMVRNEEKLLAQIDVTLRRLLGADNFVIICRRNPLYNDILINESETVIVADDFWHVDLEQDVVFQNEDGEREWVQLLKDSDFVLSSPSTVAIEAGLIGKPFLCNLLEDEGYFSEKLGKFWQSRIFETLKSDRLFNFDEISKLSHLTNVLQPKNAEARNFKGDRDPSVLSFLLKSDFSRFD